MDDELQQYLTMNYNNDNDSDINNNNTFNNKNSTQREEEYYLDNRCGRESKLISCTSCNTPFIREQILYGRSSNPSGKLYIYLSSFGWKTAMIYNCINLIFYLSIYIFLSIYLISFQLPNQPTRRKSRIWGGRWIEITIINSVTISIKHTFSETLQPILLPKKKNNNEMKKYLYIIILL